MNASWLGVVFPLLLSVASAQPNMQPPVITHVEGKVLVDGKGAGRVVTLSDDSLIRTETGRVEVRLRGGTLYVGQHSSVRVIDNRPYNFNRLELLRGSAVVETGAAQGLVVCETDVSLSDRGVFRFDLQAVTGSPDGEHICHVRVYKGAASAQLQTLVTVLRTSEEIYLNRKCGDRVGTQEFKLEDIDALDRWRTLYSDRR